MTDPVLVADIGGTNARLQLVDPDASPFTVLRETFYPSTNYERFELILEAFLKEVPQQPGRACFALAGPVQTQGEHQRGQVTRLPWLLDNQALADQFNLDKVTLLNDFEAIGHALPLLQDQDVICLQPGEADARGIRAVIGAGTGLGQAVVLPEGNDFRVMPTEGGHVGFAPQTAEQELLLHDTRRDFGHVSYDRLVSGGGLSIIYHFFQSRHSTAIPPEIQAALDQQQDIAPLISQFAIRQADKTAVDSLNMFMEIYGAQAGNLALNCLPTGGLYIAGGIALKIRPAFKDGRFLAAFRAKGRMSELMLRFPVYLVTNPQPGLLGAARIAALKP